MVKSVLSRVEKLVAERLPVEAWKTRAAEVGAQGLQVAMEGALWLQSRLMKEEPKPEVEQPLAAQPIQAPVKPPEAVREQIQATAERVLVEARAVEERIKKAQPARRPLQVTVEVDGTKPRAKGRKTAPAVASARRVTAPKEGGGFKAKRGQKHTHSH